MKKNNMWQRMGKRDVLSLLEVVLSLGIASTIFVLLIALFSATFQARVKAESIVLIETSGSFVTQTFTQAMRNAESVVTPSAATSGSSLTLTTYDATMSPTSFSVTDGVLYIQEGVGQEVALTPGNVEVQDMSFKNLTSGEAPGTVQVSFTLSRRGPSQRSEYQYSQTFQATGSIR